jgi:hypothetical protein
VLRVVDVLAFSLVIVLIYQCIKKQSLRYLGKEVLGCFSIFHLEAAVE